jgi:hypothetical protein
MQFDTHGFVFDGVVQPTELTMPLTKLQHLIRALNKITGCLNHNRLRSPKPCLNHETTAPRNPAETPSGV